MKQSVGDYYSDKSWCISLTGEINVHYSTQVFTALIEFIRRVFDVVALLKAGETIYNQASLIEYE